MTIVTIRDSGKSYRIINPGGRVGIHLVRGVPYEDKLLHFIRDLRLTGSALDVGASVGNHSLYLAAICGLTVWAFEPEQRAFNALQANIALNEELPIGAFDCALGEETAGASWRPDQRMALDPSRRGGAVPVVRYDELEAPIDLTLVKIDVEGMEPAVLAGMRETLVRYRPVLFTEAHTDDAIRAQEEVLLPIGYRREHFIHMGSRMIYWTAAA